MERKGYGYYKVAAVTFPVAIGNTEENAENIIRYIEKALQEKVQLLVFPELSVTGYTCGDMFLRGELQRQAEKSLDKIRQATEKNNLLVCVGMPSMCRAGCLTVRSICRTEKSKAPFPRPMYRTTENFTKSAGLCPRT